MRIDESTFHILDKASKITLTDYEIKWFDAENIDGYIDPENLICVIEDLMSEINYLHELIDDMKENDELNRRLVHEDAMYDAWKERNLEV